MSLLDVKPFDRQFYEEHLKDFLPDTFIDWDQTRGRTRTVQVMIIGE